MALTVAPEVTVPKSTGAAPFDGAPVVTELPADNRSTGAVAHIPPGTTSVAHLDQPVVVEHDTGGPVTTTVSWLSEVETKPVTAPEPAAAPKKTSRPKVETK
ncbi:MULTISPECIES: hypothetical protein [unclassified Rathayibacter]|uniref:hypothetical protein n=1 Tax=unclassified Rathayibacter TaxID=2609250 RepID=UPI0009814AE9|nr:MULTISPECIES: hypothetical protein [unclassified Rathayibacter]OOB90295.1 hypothetical protein B0T42_12395 [Rathayibacter sp. VKM Ac-2630]